MKRFALRLSLVLVALAGGAAHATEATNKSTSPEASIPFVRHGGIRDWEADRSRGLWIQDVHRNWYYARLMGTCWRLNFATSLGFETRPIDTFDRFSAIIVPRQGRCTVQSLTESDGPPRKHKTTRTAVGISEAHVAGSKGETY